MGEKSGFRLFIGENWSVMNEDQGSTQFDSSQNFDYVGEVAQELLKEIQHTQDVETGLNSINKALEYVKGMKKRYNYLDEAENRIKNKFKGPVVKLTSDNIILKKAVRGFVRKLDVSKYYLFV